MNNTDKNTVGIYIELVNNSFSCTYLLDYTYCGDIMWFNFNEVSNAFCSSQKVSKKNHNINLDLKEK